jgi:hypothetical protein
MGDRYPSSSHGDQRPYDPKVVSRHVSAGESMVSRHASIGESFFGFPLLLLDQQAAERVK